MANYTKLTDLFTGIANAIRSKTGGSSEIIADNFPSEISGIVTVQEGTSDATASASDILNGKTAYVNGAKVNGNLIPLEENKLSPYMMEEDIMIDLTNYTFQSSVSGTNSWSSIEPGTYIVMPYASGSSTYDVNIRFADNSQIKFNKIAKIKIDSVSSVYSATHTSVWKKNEII